MVTSDFRPEVEIRQFHACACALKNTQYNPYLWPNRRNFHVYMKLGSTNTMVNINDRTFLACSSDVNSSLVCCKQADSCDMNTT